MMRVIASSLAAGALLLSAGLADAQSTILELRNGDRISGRIVSESTNSVVVSNTWARELSIPLTDIVKRSTLSNAVAGATGTNLVVTNPVALAKTVAATNTLFSSPVFKYLHGEAQIGTDLTISERDRQIYSGKAKLVYSQGKFKANVDFDTTYGRSEVDVVKIDAGGNQRTNRTTVTDANRMNGSLKIDYEMTDRWYLYHLGGAGYDEIRKIDLRYEFGPGIGYHLIRTTNFFANLEAGANYQEEQHTDGADVSHFYFRFAENAAWKITPRLTWDEKMEYFPRMEGLDQYRIRFETNIRYALLQNIYVNVSLIDVYDSEPADGIAQNDMQIRSSVGVKF